MKFPTIRIMKSRLNREIILYLIFGVLTTIIGIGGYALFLKLGLHYVAATTLSWILAVIFAYVTNRQYVFGSEAHTVKMRLREISAFFASRAGTWLMETLGLILLIDGLSMDDMFSKYVMSVFVVIMNYILSKVFVFKSL